jgi:hypothetical protein
VTALAAGLRTADIKSEGMAVVGTTEMGTSSAGVGSIGGLMEQVLMAIGIHQRGGSFERSAAASSPNCGGHGAEGAPPFARQAEIHSTGRTPANRDKSGTATGRE